jgi:hypothetical protein
MLKTKIIEYNLTVSDWRRNYIEGIGSPHVPSAGLCSSSLANGERASLAKLKMEVVLVLDQRNRHP